MYNIVLKIILIIFLIIYPVVLYLWYKNPANFFGIKYKVSGNLTMDNFKDRNYFFIVDHNVLPVTDIMIMSQEIHKKAKDKNFVLFSRKCDLNNRIFYYKTDYEILEHKKDSVKKCIYRLKENKNLVFFLRKDHKGKGIYHILKNINVPIVLVHKKIVKNPYNKSLSDKLYKYWGMEYEIEYKLIEKYDLDKDSEEFMSWVKGELFL